MKQFLILSHCEFEKIIGKRKSKVLLLLIGIILLGASFLYYYLDNSLNLTLMNGSNFSLWTLELLMSFILPFFAAMVIADSVSGEFEHGTMVNLYALPVSRQTFYLTKIVGSLYYIAIMVGIIFSMTLLMGILTTGFGIFLSIGWILATYVKAIIALGLVIVFVGFLALWMKSSSMTLVTSAILFVALNTLGIFLGNINHLLPTTIISSFDKIFSQNHLSLLVYVVSYYIILIIIGIFKFQKKEV